MNAAIGDVDREWTLSVFRTLVRRYQGRPADVGWTPTDDAGQDSVVLLEELPGGHTRVSVAAESAGGESGVADHLERGLRMLKAFAERHR